MMLGDESQVCPTCEELEWQCQCPPAPDEVINESYPDDGPGLRSSDDIEALAAPDEDDCEDAEGLGFEDSMSLKYPLKDYDAGYDHFDQGW